MTSFVSRLARAGAVALFLVATACADDPVSTAAPLPEPVADVMLSESGAAAALDRLARFQAGRSAGAVVAQKSIGPDGGRLELGGFAIDVPPGAVTRATRFSIRLPGNPDKADRVVAVFGPHNSTFEVPVTLEFPLAGTTIAGSPTAAVVWWDGSAWQAIGGIPTADGERIEARTDHFSTYGTSDEGRGGGTLVSGG